MNFRIGWLLCGVGIQACAPKPHLKMNFTEHQLTFDTKGHTIHNNQAFSPSDEWLVYDTRNQDGGIGSTEAIEMVSLQTGEIRSLYKTEHQTEFGPGVGAATFSPVKNRVLFIHGIRNANQQKPYDFDRRTGVAIDTDQPGKAIFLDARDVTPPFTPGALRGGTHAHYWSADGQWISFTYNDYPINQLSKTNPAVKDLRVVGVMAPLGKVNVADDGSLENNSGELFSVVVTKATENPKPGSDEIDKAFDEGWIGSDGYVKPDGTRQKRAIAFQGNVRNKAGKTVTEIFVADLPDDLTQAADNQPLEGTEATRPNPPKGVTQRRITFTEHGAEGPRHWLRTPPDGSVIGFLAKDAAGTIQLFGVSPNGGAIRQLTQQPFSIQTTFNFSPDGRWVAYAADNSVFVTEVATGEFKRLTPRSSDDAKPRNGIVWSNKGNMIGYNRYVTTEKGRFLQLFVLK
ncbi:DUF3748 domain-containing protein [Larkinella rosea]|nr:DUF3748 domain-containing protein [Larkinella rosea]